MKAVLHIGMPKTGSSYLQLWLARNSQVLVGARVFAVSNAAAHRIACETLSEGQRGRPDILPILALPLTLALTELRDECLNIISSEYFFASEPKQVAARLSAAGISVTAIVCFVRRQDILSASGYAQDVKELGRSEKITSTTYTPEIDWHLTYRRWGEAFPSAELQFINYDAAKDDLATAFKSAIGITVETIDAKERVNPSLNARMTEVARMLNARKYPVPIADMIRFQAAHPGPAFSFSPELTGAFERIYLASNSALAQIVPGCASLAEPGWKPTGIDLTGQISEDRLGEFMTRLDPEA